MSVSSINVLTISSTADLKDSPSEADTPLSGDNMLSPTVQLFAKGEADRQREGLLLTSELQQKERESESKQPAALFFSSQEMLENVANLVSAFPHYAPLQFPPDTAEKIESYLQTEFTILQENFSLRPCDWMRISASALGKEKLPLSLMLLGHNRCVERVKMLFSSKASGGLIGFGVSKRVKLAMELVRSAAEVEGPWSAIAITSSAQTDRIKTMFDQGYHILLKLSGEKCVPALRSPLVTYVSHKPLAGKQEEGVCTKKAYLTSLYPQGDLFGCVITKGRKIDKEKRLAIVGKVLQALAALHDKGIYHGDIKLENILLDRNQEVGIADWDFAVQLEREKYYTISMLDNKKGSFGYLSPEQVEAVLNHQVALHMVVKGEQVLKRDVYALGIVISLLFQQTAYTHQKTENRIVLTDHIAAWMKGWKEQCEMLNILSSQSCYHSQHWLREPSAFPANLIWHMIHPNPSHRHSARDALHFFTQNQLPPGREKSSFASIV